MRVLYWFWLDLFEEVADCVVDGHGFVRDGYVVVVCDREYVSAE